MSKRPLNNSQLVEMFLTEALSLPSCNDTTNLSMEIVREENANKPLVSENTLDTSINRIKGVARQAERVNRRKKVVEELLNDTRPDNDLDITFGHGGSKPHTVLQFDKKAVIVLGPPASGKSYLANRIADAIGAYVLDADHAKQKLPEFQNGKGAVLLHEESVAMIFGNGNAGLTSLLEHVINRGANLVIPKVGMNKDKIEKLNKVLRLNKYSVSLVLTSVSKFTATVRSIERFKRTGRYIPLGYIFDEVGHEPHLTYYRLRTANSKTRIWESYAAYDTEKEQPKIICCSKKWPKEILSEEAA